MKRRTAALLSAVALVSTAAATVPSAWASPSQSAVVSDRPVAGPQIADNTVYAITQVGDVVVAGGSFTKVGSQARKGVVAWSTTAKQVTSFAPQFNGTVRTLLPGPISGTVWVGGEFSTMNGSSAKSLVLLRVADGTRVTAFDPPGMDGVIDSVELVGNRLYVAGTFTKLGGKARGGIAALDATTGAVLDVMTSVVTGHHSWTPDTPKQTKAPVGVDRLAVTPDGTRLVAIGNFTEVDGQPRDQVAMWDLTATSSTLRDWHPPRYEAKCSLGYDSYVRDVDFSPDGSYFVIASTGGRHGGSLCDSAARFETSDSGLSVAPTWVSTSGADSLLSVAITGTVVYLGGHERWLNNPLGGDVPGPGAVPRPGIAAVDPTTGVPMAWNPGRHPRGAGTYVLFPTSTGLWVGSDTNFLGHSPAVSAGKIGFFPLAGGAPPASKAAPSLPATVVLGPRTTGSYRAVGFSGSGVTSTATTTSPLTATQLRGATTIGGTLFYGKSDGLLYERTLSSSGTYGPEAVVDPYDDPYWSTKKSGSIPPLVPAGQTYRGVLPDFYTDAGRSSGKAGQLESVSSMFYDAGTSRLYYTLVGKNGLFYRPFSPDVQRTPGQVTTGGVLYPKATTVSGVSLPPITGAFLTGGYLYYAKASDGTLNRVAFTGGKPVGSAVNVGGSIDWRSGALYLRP